MQRISIFAVLFVAIGVAQAWAAPACGTTEMTLSYYESLGATGCQVGDKIFSNFTYTDSAGGSGSLITDTSIEVTTLGPTTGGDPAETSNANIGLNFTAAWSVVSNCPTPTTCSASNEDSNIGFTVTVVGGANMAITDAAVLQTSSGALGTGSSAQVSEGGCSPVAPATTCTPGMWGLLSVVTPGDYAENLADTMLSPTGSVTVLKDIVVTAGAVVGGAATLSSVNDTFSQSLVPEPATMLLVGGALCGIAVIRRRSARL